MAYVRALFIPDALERAGLTVHRMRGWKTRGRPRSVGGFDPRALMLHHDASAKGDSPGEKHHIAVVGNPDPDPDKNVPAPLAHCWVDRHGEWWVIASGRCNHAGTGAGFGRIPEDCGNYYAIGVETDHTKNERWPKKQIDAVRLGFAALADAMSIKPENSICGHREYTSRKIDPSGVDMDEFRDDVRGLMRTVRGGRGAPPATPAPVATTDPLPVVRLAELEEAAHLDPPAAQGHVTHKRSVLAVERALRDEGLLDAGFVDGSFGTLTVKAYAEWQRSLGYRGSDADGIPGVASLTQLGRVHGFRVKR